MKSSSFKLRRMVLCLAHAFALLTGGTTSAMAQSVRDGGRQGGGFDMQHRHRGHGHFQNNRGHNHYQRHYGRDPSQAYLQGYRGDRRYMRGERLPLQYRDPRYTVGDWRQQRLAPPPRGYRYVRLNGGNIALAAIATGVIVAIVNVH